MSTDPQAPTLAENRTVLIAIDKFRGSLDATAAAACLHRGVVDANREAQVETIRISDGGDGLIDVARAAGYSPVERVVTGPLGRPVRARMACSGSAFVIEAAQAAGLHLSRATGAASLRASSYGVGQLILHTLDLEATDIVVGVGGTACTDGGLGMLRALGLRAFDSRGRELAPSRTALAEVHSVDITGLDQRIADVFLTMAVDVQASLLGAHGAARLFAPQKGARKRQVSVLERSLATWAAMAPYDLRAAPGSGAGGGLAFGAMSYLGAHVARGVDVALDLARFDERCERAGLVITGEGHLDRQSLLGKVPVGVASRAARRGVPTVAVAGIVSLSAQELQACDISQAYSLRDLEPDERRSMRDAPELLRRLGRQIALDWLS